MERWIEICRLDDIPPLGARVVTAKGGNIALFRGAGDEVYGLDDRCPHKGGPLSQGIVHGERITCPLHNWVMELKSGEAVAPDVGCATVYPVRLENGAVHISLPESAAGPVKLVVIEGGRAVNE